MAAWAYLTETLPIGLLLLQTLVGVLHPLFAAVADGSKTISINSGHSPRPMMMSAEAAGRTDKAVSSVGPREVSASVSASFELD